MMDGAPRAWHTVGAQHQVTLISDNQEPRPPALHSLWRHLSPWEAPWLPAGRHRWCPRPHQSVSDSLQSASVRSGYTHPVSEQVPSTPLMGRRRIARVASCPLLRIASCSLLLLAACRGDSSRQSRRQRRERISGLRAWKLERARKPKLTSILS